MIENKDNTLKWTFYLFPMDWRMVFRVVAVLVSWYFNHSLLWSVIHYCFGWLYLIYVILNGGFADGGLGEIIKYYFG